MLELYKSTKFKTDWKSFNKCGIKNIEKIRENFAEIIKLLQSGRKLPEVFQDHPLKNNKHGLRDCHVVNDWVLIYEITDSRLILHRFNRHANLFWS